MGQKYTVLGGLPVRRVLLPKTGTHIYDSVDEDAELVTVLAASGAPRGRGPKL